MGSRVLLGFVAALRAGFLPGQADLLMSQPLSWPRRRRVSRLALADERGEPVRAPAT